MSETPSKKRKQPEDGNSDSEDEKVAKTPAALIPGVAPPLPTIPECELRINRLLADHNLQPMAPPPTDRPIRIYADGIYDLFHYGHARALLQAKNLFPNVYLLVGVCNDELTHRMKGKTVMNDQERYEAVRHCKHVDEVVENAPWVLDPEFLALHQIDYVTHDAAPYAASGVSDVYAFLKESGRFIPTERTEGISTSDLIMRIVRDYDDFVRRNLARGYKRQDMNVSFLKEKQIRLMEVGDRVDHKLDEIQSNIETNVSNLTGNIEKWAGKAETLLDEFMMLFRKNGLRRINALVQDGLQKLTGKNKQSSSS
eukprot:TRINITY_DN11300_c0_g1_i2.p1 TRINITY_DN11300_c0_g1~~TRINITY_DN11300_c0_g1_i2.p1  ORF type:complete len:336 (-),score=100.15 TRINITY_DN11300_c0_g1_i2:823-1758(-)